MSFHQTDAGGKIAEIVKCVTSKETKFWKKNIQVECFVWGYLAHCQGTFCYSWYPIPIIFSLGVIWQRNVQVVCFTLYIGP